MIYCRINFLDELIEKKWCTHFELVLKSAGDHDTREKIIISLLSLVENCKKEFFENESLIQVLSSMYNEYNALVNLEKDLEDDNYFKNIINYIGQVLRLIDTNKKQEL